MIDRREHAEGTYLTQSFPWGLFIGGRAMCSDGRVRNLKRMSETSDTFFSVPASVTVKGKTVAGYVTVECVSGSSVPTDNDPAMVKFIANTYRKNHSLLPDGAYRKEVK